MSARPFGNTRQTYKRTERARIEAHLARSRRRACGRSCRDVAKGEYRRRAKDVILPGEAAARVATLG